MSDTRYDAFISYRREVPLMRRYYNINGVENGLMKVSYYIYGNPYPDQDCQIVIEALDNAIFYQGDSNVLLLAPEGKKTYIQFAHNKQD